MYNTSAIYYREQYNNIFRWTQMRRTRHGTGSEPTEKPGWDPTLVKITVLQQSMYFPLNIYRLRFKKNQNTGFQNI